MRKIPSASDGPPPLSCGAETYSTPVRLERPGQQMVHVADAVHCALSHRKKGAWWVTCHAFIRAEIINSGEPGITPELIAECGEAQDYFLTRMPDGSLRRTTMAYKGPSVEGPAKSGFERGAGPEEK